LDLSSGLAVSEASVTSDLYSDLIVEFPDTGQIFSFPSLDSDLAVFNNSGGLSDLYSSVIVGLKPAKFLFSSISVYGLYAVPLDSDMFVV
jgi:hypothetical protein